ncbi:hypothetical protein L2E82_51576 [Cichorium intybus]|nr:hypothetical protein L2E82_51576 [Cichorium intybus]
MAPSPETSLPQSPSSSLTNPSSPPPPNSPPASVVTPPVVVTPAHPQEFSPPSPVQAIELSDSFFFYKLGNTDKRITLELSLLLQIATPSSSSTPPSSPVAENTSSFTEEER